MTYPNQCGNTEIHDPHDDCPGLDGTEHAALQVQCPDCTAPAGTFCYSASAHTTHAARYDTARLRAAETGTCSLCGKMLARGVRRAGEDVTVWHPIPEDAENCPEIPDPITDPEAWSTAINLGAQPGYPGPEHFIPGEPHPCGHTEVTPGCGGCDPAAIDYVIEPEGLAPLMVAGALNVPGRETVPLSGAAVMIPGLRGISAEDVIDALVERGYGASEEVRQRLLRALREAVVGPLSMSGPADLDQQIDALHGPGAAAAVDAAYADGTIFAENPPPRAWCPECTAGKHQNCVGQALDPVTDEIGSCACQDAGHAAP